MTTTKETTMDEFETDANGQRIGFLLTRAGGGYDIPVPIGLFHKREVMNAHLDVLLRASTETFEVTEIPIWG
jgi:hypothetical protein